MRRLMILLAILLVAAVVASGIVYASELRGEHAFGAEYSGELTLVASEMLEYALSESLSIGLAYDALYNFAGLESWFDLSATWTPFFGIDLSLGATIGPQPALYYVRLTYPW